MWPMRGPWRILQYGARLKIGYYLKPWYEVMKVDVDLP